jgi:hypothetical protein
MLSSNVNTGTEQTNTVVNHALPGHLPQQQQQQSLMPPPPAMFHQQQPVFISASTAHGQMWIPIGVQYNSDSTGNVVATPSLSQLPIQYSGYSPSYDMHQSSSTSNQLSGLLSNLNNPGGMIVLPPVPASDGEVSTLKRPNPQTIEPIAALPEKQQKLIDVKETIVPTPNL